jgi:hypothetical protein
MLRSAGIRACGVELGVYTVGVEGRAKAWGRKTWAGVVCYRSVLQGEIAHFPNQSRRWDVIPTMEKGHEICMTACGDTDRDGSFVYFRLTGTPDSNALPRSADQQSLRPGSATASAVNQSPVQYYRVRALSDPHHPMIHHTIITTPTHHF